MSGKHKLAWSKGQQLRLIHARSSGDKLEESDTKKKRKTEEKGTLRCNPVNSVVKKRRQQMKTAERPAGQSAWQKSAYSKQLSVWKGDPSSSMDGAEIILQGRKSARTYRNQTQEQHPPELRPQQLAERKCCDSSEKEAHRDGPAHIHCPTIFSYRWLPGKLIQLKRNHTQSHLVSNGTNPASQRRRGTKVLSN